VTGRSPARLLAPAALVATAVALFAVVASGSGGSSDGEPAATPVATATATPERERRGGGKDEAEASGDTYVVEPGDTPLAIAEKTGVDLDALLAANPGLDANALTVGQEIVIP
jgi:FlaG/FlaF family flagellin (archaellin)